MKKLIWSMVDMLKYSYWQNIVRTLYYLFYWPSNDFHLYYIILWSTQTHFSIEITDFCPEPFNSCIFQITIHHYSSHVRSCNICCLFTLNNLEPNTRTKQSGLRLICTSFVTSLCLSFLCIYGSKIYININKKQQQPKLFWGRTLIMLVH